MSLRSENKEGCHEFADLFCIVFVHLWLGRLRWVHIINFLTRESKVGMDSIELMDESADVGTAQLPGLVKEWMAIQDELLTLSAAVREKRNRIKTVRALIMKVMKGEKIGQLKISAGSVMARSKKVKASITKKYMLSTLTDYFKGDAAAAAACVAYLEENRPLKVQESLTLEPSS